MINIKIDTIPIPITKYRILVVVSYEEKIPNIISINPKIINGDTFVMKIN